MLHIHRKSHKEYSNKVFFHLLVYPSLLPFLSIFRLLFSLSFSWFLSPSISYWELYAPMLTLPLCMWLKWYCSLKQKHILNIYIWKQSCTENICKCFKQCWCICNLKYSIAAESVFQITKKKELPVFVAWSLNIGNSYKGHTVQ